MVFWVSRDHEGGSRPNDHACSQGKQNYYMIIPQGGNQRNKKDGQISSNKLKQYYLSTYFVSIYNK